MVVSYRQLAAAIAAVVLIRKRQQRGPAPETRPPPTSRKYEDAMDREYRIARQARHL